MMTHHSMIQTTMKYHLYDEHHVHQGTFESIQKLRETFYVRESMTMMTDHICHDTFDYIKQIKWHFDIEE